jgi:hypothetical protein
VEQVKRSAFAGAGKRARTVIDVSPVSRDNPFRRERMQRLKGLVEAVIAEKGACKIIDIGGTVGFWETWEHLLDFSKVTIDCVNVAPADATGHLPIRMLVGDARDLTFAADNAYDVAFSNSVIEHVGLWHDMERMAAEVRRVASRYLVQTPYFWFPIEPHARTPLIHWLPESWKYRIVMRRKCGFWERQDSVAGAVRTVQSAIMLDIRQMRALFPDADLHKERFCGLIKSLVAVKG